MPGTRRLPLHPPMSSPLLYLLPAQLLSPLARAADGQAPESGSGSAEGSTPEGKWAGLPR